MNCDRCNFYFFEGRNDLNGNFVMVCNEYFFDIRSFCDFIDFGGFCCNVFDVSFLIIEF